MREGVEKIGALSETETKQLMLTINDQSKIVSLSVVECFLLLRSRPEALTESIDFE
jgi:hypothetical protein